MTSHPLKIISLSALAGLIACQLSLPFSLQNEYRLLIAVLLTAPLLIPIKGFLTDRRYTYKWSGFLTMLYLCIGISESFASSKLSLYAVFCTLFSAILFISSIYYSRYLRRITP